MLKDLGRKIGGRWMISRVALAMFLDGRVAALDLYLRGDRRSEAVIAYYAQLGIPLPRSHVLMEVVMRNGKKLGDCTRADLYDLADDFRAMGAQFERFGKAMRQIIHNE